MFFLGIDIGTQGIRGLVVDEKGNIISSGSRRFTRLNLTENAKCYEQAASDWIESVIHVIEKCVYGLKEKGGTPEDIAGIAVDGTSGTILPVDSGCQPLTNALMYNDTRADTQAELVQTAGEGLSENLGYQFKSSFSLPKILWIKHNQPDIYAKTRRFLHQSDFIVGFLTGNFQNSDYSNALKTGYDLINNCWPKFIESKLGLSLEKFPDVHPPGTIVGSVSKSIAQLTGLSQKTRVCVGATDGNASALAAGIKKPGDYNTTIGTTLVIKGLTTSITHDRQGRIYSHRHPDGFWMPGGASNTGGICLNHHFKDRKLAELDKQVNLSEPSRLVCYPLIGIGERFPFLAPDAEGFIKGKVQNELQFYTALLEGVAYTERLSYEVMAELGCDPVNTVYTAGGAAKSLVWLKIRANILNRRLLVPKVVEASMGAAILAASTIRFNGTSEAVDAMVKIDKEVIPDPKISQRYNSFYSLFKTACTERGYINSSGETL